MEILHMFNKPSIKFQCNGIYIVYLMRHWFKWVLILSPWIRCRNRSVNMRTRACTRRWLTFPEAADTRAGYHSRSHACTARTFRRQKSAGCDRPGEKRERRVNVRNTCGFAVWEFKHVLYNSNAV